ncbi:MAG: FAD-dependent oxidoreductase [Bacteroidota bacterium]
MSEFVRVASVSDLADGEMRQVEAGDAEVLLSRVDGHFHACTAFCTHYGAPLATGVLDGTKVVCPWHHAVFDVASGALDEPPAPDALRTFEVRVEGDAVLVRVPPDASTHGKGVPYRVSDGRPPAMARPNPEADDRLFLLLGGGAAAQAAAEELRASGYQGRLVLVTPEARPPYDRTALSKGYLGGGSSDALRLRDGSFYEAHGIELWTEKTATALDPAAKTVTLSNGETVAYDACLVATGGAPRRLPIDGADLDGVHVLRSWRDADAVVRRSASAERVAIIGASFIGMEAASSLIGRGLEVTVIGREQTPFGHTLGPEVGAVFQRAAEAKGVQFRLGADVERIETIHADPSTRAGGGLRVVADGEGTEADLVLLGVGVRPATDFLEGAAFRRGDGGLETDATLRLGDGLYAAGDVAAYPESRLRERVRIEHWRLAQQHGRHAARNMAAPDAARPFESVPFFWTGQFGVGLRYVGHVRAWDEVVVQGSLEDRSFLAAYVHGGEVRALAAVGRDKDAAAFYRLVAQGQTPTPGEIRSGLDLQARLRGEA